MADETVDELKSKADKARADAEEAAAESKRTADAAASLHADAVTKVSDANKAAEAAAQESLRKQVEVAEADAAAKRAEYATAQAEVVAAQAKALTLKGEAEAAAQLAADLADSMKPLVPSFRVEGGSWRTLKEGSTARDWQVQDTNGLVYNHVSDHANGDYVYRLQG